VLPITVQFDPVHLRQLEQGLGPTVFQESLYSAIKKAQSKGKTLLKKEIGQYLNLKPGPLAEQVTAPPPHGNPPSATLRIQKKHPIPVFDFRGSHDTGHGVVAQFLKDKPPIFFPHYFEATVKAGTKTHTGFFGRTKHFPTQGPNVGKFQKLTASGFVQRFTIAEVFGPSAYDLLQKTGQLTAIGQRITAKLQDLLNYQLRDQLYRFGLGGKPDRPEPT
jgi:hypothetical protein